MESVVMNKPINVGPIEGWSDIVAGNLAVHIAETSSEIKASQALRYHIFYEEMGGTAPYEASLTKLDRDEFDDYCDHLLVMDYGLSANQVVGTYRLLKRSATHSLGKFYTESEFNINAIKQHKGEILELGRSCVNPNYRNRAVMQLLWRGIGAYVAQYNVKLMFGCASLFGTDVQSHALSLSYLYHFHMAPPEMRGYALPDRYVEMNLIPKDAINPKEAFAGLPALIKGYLRVGGYIGDGAVIDPICNTIDVSVVVKTDLVTEKYVQRYAGPSLKSEE